MKYKDELTILKTKVEVNRINKVKSAKNSEEE